MYHRSRFDLMREGMRDIPWRPPVIGLLVIVLGVVIFYGATQVRLEPPVATESNVTPQPLVLPVDKGIVYTEACYVTAWFKDNLAGFSGTSINLPDGIKTPMFREGLLTNVSGNTLSVVDIQQEVEAGDSWVALAVWRGCGDSHDTIQSDDDNGNPIP